MKETDLNSIITSKELSELATGYGEIAVDGFLEDGLLKDIPVIGTLVKLVSFGNSVNKILFIRKVYRFLFELQNTTVEERAELIRKIESSEKHQSKVGEAVFEILDKIDSEGKPTIIGRLFAATIKGEIDYLDFLRVSYIVQSQFYFDLIAFKEHVDSGNLEGANISETFSGSGLTTFSFLPALDKGLGCENSDPTRGVTEYGKILLNIGMRDQNTRLV